MNPDAPKDPIARADNEVSESVQISPSTGVLSGQDVLTGTRFNLAAALYDGASEQGNHMRYHIRAFGWTDMWAYDPAQINSITVAYRRPPNRSAK